MAFQIDADSTPAYDGWGWADYWDCYDWITWHKALTAKYGVAQANATFLQAWDKQDTFFAAPVDCRSFNSEFKQYAKDNGFYDGLFSGIGAIAQPIAAGTSVVTAASNLVGNTADSANTASKYLKYVIPVLAITLLAGIIYYVYKKSKTQNTNPTP